MKNEKKNELAPMRTINEESCNRFTHELKKQTNKHASRVLKQNFTRLGFKR